jgi:hypothetical protein
MGFPTRLTRSLPATSGKGDSPEADPPPEQTTTPSLPAFLLDKTSLPRPDRSVGAIPLPTPLGSDSFGSAFNSVDFPLVVSVAPKGQNCKGNEINDSGRGEAGHEIEHHADSCIERKYHTQTLTNAQHW